MGEYSFLLAIAIVFMFGTMSPGPSFILVAKTAVSKPFNEGIGVSIGLSIGAVCFTLLAIFGLYALFETVPFLYGIFKLLGGIYLIYLALYFYLGFSLTTTYDDKYLDSENNEN